MFRLSLALLALSVWSACGPRELRVTMNADNNSGQTGFAIIEDRGAKIFVTVETSAPDFFGGSGQHIHIHEGNCGEVGQIRAGLGKMMPLPDQPDRFGTTMEAALPLKTFQTGEWLINVHDERDPLIYVSCGEIRYP